jgi:hypothetical protein
VNPYKNHPAEHSAAARIPIRLITGEIISLWWQTLPERDGLRVAGCGVRVTGCELRVTGCGLRPRKFQAPKNKSQTNPNDPNSKFETAELVAGQTKRLPTVGLMAWSTADLSIRSAGIQLQREFRSLNIGIWDLFVIWCLRFGISDFNKENVLF